MYPAVLRQAAADPVSRAALLLGPIFAGAVILGIQASIVIGVGLLLGLEPETRPERAAGRGRAGDPARHGLRRFTVSAALGSGSAAATQGASFLFFPLNFLTASFVP
jgi:ABC-2 type transport system permease protein